jgi:hypothetical protein
LWSISFRFFHRNHVCFSLLPHLCYMPHPSDTPLSLHLNIWWDAKSLSHFVIQCSPAFWNS